ncbi:ribose 1,5-bisphosphate isomerase [Hyperthermus butylicus]|uniref:Ribose 1,5-bisphosphate isomerase n=1 Tax=Hyperthermus butylicus (strain DSM 5456 / JCM 9403 / PLM1-5) TaxID=415426 RepID=A2BK49_HYPBU|nr:ribose 1,5-bisphosphate isomerase [Hyperthermus butylicus]ABM80360.1 translation initiation factor eIF-2B subunit 2 [Hyperthermus butylicus DSM 5456]
MEFPEEVTSIAEDIKTMKIRGAGRIAKAAARALMIAAERFQGGSVDEFVNYMRATGELLISTRPTAVSLPNAVNYVLRVLEERRYTSVEEVRKAVIEAARSFIEYSEQALKKIGEIGARLIKTGDRILTHCNSKAVESILITAWRQGKRFEVYATETRPRYQGHITSMDLAMEGIPVTLIPDAAVLQVMESKRITKVIVGADTVTANGAVINKIGTSQIALAARLFRIPFIVATETYKFSPYTVVGQPVEIEERPAEEVLPAHIPGVKVRNPAFDATPPDYIDMIVTERGIIPPKSAALMLWELFHRKPSESRLPGVEEDSG